ncbi:MAG: AAA family ATPase [Deltaproteobacteria bacterium]|nr:AAA family ATPase [Deltaproteobacteria bacterium]
MTYLYIGSTGDHAGQSLITWAIGRRLVEKGLKVGLMKPFGANPVQIGDAWADRDALLFKEILHLEERLDQICPYFLPGDQWRGKGPDAITEEVKALALELRRNKDILLLLGSRDIFFDDIMRPVSDVEFVRELEAPFVLAHRYQRASASIYSILSIRSLLKDQMKGVIINRVNPEKQSEVRTHLVPKLMQSGIPFITAVFEDPSLSARSIKDIVASIEGEVLCGAEYMNRPAGGGTVGSSDLKEGLGVFKRVYNKIVLLAPSSPEVEVEDNASARSITGIILTGGRKPRSFRAEDTRPLPGR